jgi:hypothetical protein
MVDNEELYRKCKPIPTVEEYVEDLILILAACNNKANV